MREEAPTEEPVFQRNDPDAEAVRAAMAGDMRAFSGLIEKLQLRVFRFILRQGLAEAEAEDLTQETFLEIHRCLHKFQGRSLFSTWVLGIAYNMSRNLRSRSPRYRYEVTGDDELERHADSGHTPEQEAMVQGRLKALRKGMEEVLSPNLRQALTLVSLEGLPYEEAAEIAGIPVNTLKTRVFRARKQLKDALIESGHI